MSAIHNKEVFAENLMFYIQKHEKDQKEVADALNIPPSTFNAYVKAKKYPRIEKIEKIANYFGISKSDLIEKCDAFEKHGYSITTDEQRLLDIYRKVPEQQKKLVLDIINVVIADCSEEP